MRCSSAIGHARSPLSGVVVLCVTLRRHQRRTPLGAGKASACAIINLRETDSKSTDESPARGRLFTSATGGRGTLDAAVAREMRKAAGRGCRFYSSAFAASG